MGVLDGFFASGGLVYGVVQNAHYFVLVYYGQELGLSPELAGLAVGIGQYKVTPGKASSVPLSIGSAAVDIVLLVVAPACLG